jgi:hypothetical protein
MCELVNPNSKCKLQNAWRCYPRAMGRLHIAPRCQWERHPRPAKPVCRCRPTTSIGDRSSNRRASPVCSESPDPACNSRTCYPSARDFQIEVCNSRLGRVSHPAEVSHPGDGFTGRNEFKTILGGDRGIGGTLIPRFPMCTRNIKSRVW